MLACTFLIPCQHSLQTSWYHEALADTWYLYLNLMWLKVTPESFLQLRKLGVVAMCLLWCMSWRVKRDNFNFSVSLLTIPHRKVKMWNKYVGQLSQRCLWPIGSLYLNNKSLAYMQIFTLLNEYSSATGASNIINMWYSRCCWTKTSSFTQN